AIAGLGAGGWATWVALHAPATTEELCAPAGREVERVWSAARRGEVVAGISAADTRDAAARFADQIDAYASAWSARRVELCRLAPDGAAGPGRDQRPAARLACLTSRLTQLDAAVSVFTHASNAHVAGRAEAIAADLPPLAACDAVDTTVAVTEERRD